MYSKYGSITFEGHLDLDVAVLVCVCVGGSLRLSVCLSICLAGCLSVCLSFCLSVSVLCVRASVCVCVCLCVCVCFDFLRAIYPVLPLTLHKSHVTSGTLHSSSFENTNQKHSLPERQYS